MLDSLRHRVTYELLHRGDCKLLGVVNADSIFIEEIYGEDDWLAQHHLSSKGGILETRDENDGKNLDIEWFKLPVNIVTPPHHSCCDHLNFSGARLRGIQREERIEEVVYPLLMDEKIALIEFMEWDINPLHIIGIAESTIISHTMYAGHIIVCRRVRVAYKLEASDHDYQAYDYDSKDVYMVHEVESENSPMPDLVNCLNDIDEIVLLRPMDCLFVDGMLYIADGGEEDDVSAIHIFELQE